MIMNDYTLVLGVDFSHLEKLRMVWQSWARFKPSLLRCRVVVFYDKASVRPEDIAPLLTPKPDTLDTFAWPPAGLSIHDYAWPERPAAVFDKWSNPQRYMMLSGFVHVPALCQIETPYWLKLDLDAVATGHDDWVDPSWFKDNPAIVSQPWGYTKPADQMLKLDQWVDRYAEHLPILANQPPLNLVPKEGSSLVKHPRIISWCGFFSTGFTSLCSAMASTTCGRGRLPVPSQDGFMFYAAKRAGLPIHIAQMKSRGFEHHNGNAAVKAAVERSLGHAI